MLPQVLAVEVAVHRLGQSHCHPPAAARGPQVLVAGVRQDLLNTGGPAIDKPSIRY